MAEYSVTWHIDQLDADTPVGAAREALDMLRDRSSIATVFDVRDGTGARYRVDLDDCPPVPVVLRAPSTTRRRSLAGWRNPSAAVLDNAPHAACPLALCSRP